MGTLSVTTNVPTYLPTYLPSDDFDPSRPKHT